MIICPVCGSKNVIKILYGMPTTETFQAEERGEVKLGGCRFSKESPTKHCNACGEDFK